MSSQAAWWQESQAWSLLGLAQGNRTSYPTGGPVPLTDEQKSVLRAQIQSVPQPPTPAPVARRKPGPKPKPKESEDIVAELKARWEAEERDE
jgi:hypothetical protein